MIARTCRCLLAMVLVTALLCEPTKAVYEVHQPLKIPFKASVRPETRYDAEQLGRDVARRVNETANQLDVDKKGQSISLDPELMMNFWAGYLSNDPAPRFAELLEEARRIKGIEEQIRFNAENGFFARIGNQIRRQWRKLT
ncbi:unnamed protein product, partial [Mesorhabditis spiculigera]